MPQDFTTADAQGNAQARVTVSTSAPPEELRFKAVLTPEEIDLHFQWNENIIQFAERIDELEQRLDNAEVLLEEARAAQAETHRIREANLADMPPEMAERMRNVGFDMHQQQINQLQAGMEIDRREIERYEAMIEAEIDQVRNEYRDLAEALTEGREDYIEAKEIRASRPAPEISLEYRGLLDNYDHQATREWEIAHEEVRSYERILEDYHLIEQGYAHMTSSEMWAAFRNEAAIFIATEVVTLGAAKVLKLAKGIDYVVNAIRATSYAQALARRVANLSARVKNRLDRIRRRVREPEPETRGPDGNTNQAPAKGQVGRSCATGRCTNLG